MSELMGFEGIRQVSKQMSANRANGGNFGPKELWMAMRNPGDSVEVRFLEQGDEVAALWMHEYNQGKRFKFAKCLDQAGTGAPCPGCDNNFKRTVRGFVNVIWRNAPILKRGEDGRAIKTDSGQFLIEGHQDELAVWSQGITVFEELADKDQTYRGLKSRDFKITKKSKGYTIDPVLDENGNANASPMTEADQKLESQKYDLRKEYFPELSYDETLEVLNGGGGAPSGGGVKQEDIQTRSPFAGRGESTGRGNRFLDS